MRTNTRRRSPGFDISSSFVAGSEESRADHLKGLTDRLETAARLAQTGDLPAASEPEEDRSVVTSLRKPAREPEQARAQDNDDDLARLQPKAVGPSQKRQSRVADWNRGAELPAQGQGLGLKADALNFLQKTVNIRPDQNSLIRQIAAIEGLRNNNNITFSQALRVIIDLGLNQVSEHYAAEEERLG